MYNLSTKAHEGPSSQQRPTQAHKEGKRTICMFFLIMYFSIYFSFFILLAGCTTPTTPLFGVDDSHEIPQRPQQSTKADAGPRRGKTAHMYVFLSNVFFKKFTTYSQKHTKAHSNQRRPTKANAGPQQPTEGQRRPTKAHSTQRP